MNESISNLLLRLYDQVSDNANEQNQKIIQECLDIWDEMFEKNLGSIRKIRNDILNQK